MCTVYIMYTLTEFVWQKRCYHCLWSILSDASSLNETHQRHRVSVALLFSVPHLAHLSALATSGREEVIQLWTQDKDSQGAVCLFVCLCVQ